MYSRTLTNAIGLLLALACLPSSQGSTKDTFIQRCNAYKAKPVISSAKDAISSVACSNVWEIYENSGGDFSAFVRAMKAPLPYNSALFWSATKNFAQRYSDTTPNQYTLEKTFIGYCMDGLNSDPNFWNAASATFAELAKGTVNVMLNASNPYGAFPFDRTFARYELPNLSGVTLFNVRLVYNRGNKRETCTEGESMMELKRRVQAKDFPWSCTMYENPGQ